MGAVVGRDAIPATGLLPLSSIPYRGPFGYDKSHILREPGNGLANGKADGAFRPARAHPFSPQHTLHISRVDVRHPFFPNGRAEATGWELGFVRAHLFSPQSTLHISAVDVYHPFVRWNIR